MKKITMYKASDGSLLETAAECQKYELHCELVKWYIDNKVAPEVSWVLLWIGWTKIESRFKNS